MRHLITDIDPGLAIVSFVAAVTTAFVALELAARAVCSSGRPRQSLLVVSGLTMGGGIWGMHFLAMLGIDADMGTSYRPDLVLLSIVCAAAGSTVSLSLVARPQVPRTVVALAASFMGLAVSAMHYIGMASMESDARMTWNVPLVVLSMVVAFVASAMALGAVASMNGERTEWSPWGRFAAAIGLGVAVAGLHYIGMSAVTFHVHAATEARGGVDLGTSALATVMGVGASLLLLVVTVDGSRQKHQAELAGDLAVFARVSRDIGRRGDARQTVCVAARDLVACDVVLLLEPDGDGDLAVSATSGEPFEMRVGMAPGQSVGGDAMRLAERRFVPDARLETTADPEAVFRTGAVSVLYEPVLLDDRAVGMLAAVWHHRVHSLSDRRLAITGLLAAEAAVAIERADLVDQLRRQALVDGLTGLPNRRALDVALDDGVRRAARAEQPFTVAMVDVDRFKDYNDAHGHPEGDRLLADIAGAWRGELRGADVIGRFGGEEFLLLLPGVGTAIAARVIERLRAVVPEAVTCSFGLATWDGVEGASGLVVRADAALYEAKVAGRDRVVVG